MLLRRASPVVAYWGEGRLILENFVTRSRISVDPAVFPVLSFFDTWRSAADLTARLPQYDVHSVQRTLEELCKHGFLERSKRPPGPRSEAIREWGAWNPPAGFFHFSTKDVEFAEDPWAAIRAVQRHAKRVPPPRPEKKYQGARRIPLVRAHTDGEFPQVLLRRRTWRKFSSSAVPLASLATVLQLTFGIQSWAEIPGMGKVAVKTSPSGGSLHPIEAYVVARRVRDLKSGIYHYNGATHELQCLGKGVSREFLRRNLGHQGWFADAPFLILMTAVFERTRWKYAYARAYRAVLLEAGHLCQTFCLAATWLGLGPFCTIAFADTKWEGRLGIDGVRESVVYAAGAGLPPADEENAHIHKIKKSKR